MIQDGGVTVGLAGPAERGDVGQRGDKLLTQPLLDFRPVLPPPRQRLRGAARLPQPLSCRHQPAAMLLRPGVHRPAGLLPRLQAILRR